MHVFGAFGLGLTFTLSLATPASAESGASSGPETVIVTATRSAAPLSEVPVSATAITRDEIADTPAQALDDVLRTIPSVNLPAAASYQTHPLTDVVSMRGLGGTRALALLDGVPLNDPFFGYVQWSMVPLEDVQRVEVVRGGGAPLWGNFAMGGVINVITRAPDRQQFDLEGGYGSYGTYRVDGYGAVALSDDVKLDVNASTNGTDGYETIAPARRSPINVPNAFDSHNVQSDLSVAFDPSLTGIFRVGYHDTDQTLYTPKSGDSQKLWNASGQLVKALGTSSLTATAFVIDSDARTDNTATPFGVPAGTAEYVQNRHLTPATELGGSVIWTMPVRDWLPNLSLGLDYQQIQGRDTGLIFNSGGAQIRTDLTRGRQQFVGGFAQVEITPSAVPLQILASARAQYFENYGGFDGTPGGAGTLPSRSATSFDPRVSVRYKLSDIFALRAAGYEAFRAPTLNELYRSYSTPFGISYANPLLKPETLKGGEAGLDVTLPDLRAQLTYYYNTVDDLITSRHLTAAELPAGFFSGTRGINAGALEAQGFEAEVAWTIRSDLAATFGYTYARSIVTKNPLDPLSVGRQLGGVPRNVVSGQLTYTTGWGLRLSTRLRWEDKSWADNDGTLPLGEHFVADLSAAYAVSANYEVFANAENLSDTQYIAHNSGFSAPALGQPFTLFAGVRTSFQ